MKRKSEITKESVANRIKGRLARFVDALSNDEAISEKFTCRTVALKLQPLAYGPQRVVRARKVLGTSQAVFAQFLGVKLRTVQAWEQGENIPSDMACRFMDEIQLNPRYWQKRLKDEIRVKVHSPNKRRLQPTRSAPSSPRA